ncbi:MAG TPA: cytochrome c [Burkholderiaceae bacterium]|jgi:mono/diheme cytochrome c family protein|nr:cytochrome c [Burkholderiaceae bacterium]
MSQITNLRVRLASALLVSSLSGSTLAFGPAPASTSGAGSVTLSQATESAPAPAPVASPDFEKQGEELFGRNCQLCHNSRGKGGKAPQLLRGAWGPGGANSDEFMFNTIKNGRPNTQMGGFNGSLSDAEIRIIVAFLRSESVRAKANDRKTVSTDYEPW